MHKICIILSVDGRLVFPFSHPYERCCCDHSRSSLPASLGMKARPREWVQDACTSSAVPDNAEFPSSEAVPAHAGSSGGAAGVRVVEHPSHI